MMQNMQNHIEQIQEESIDDQNQNSTEYIYYENCQLKLAKHVLEGFTTQ